MLTPRLQLLAAPLLADTAGSSWAVPPEGWVWFALGMSGNLVFGSRFFIQWLYSEKHRESKVPVIFWWISVFGTLLLAAYFIRLKNWVGILGHGPNLIPYTRNLMLIYRKRRLDSAAREAAEAVVGFPEPGTPDSPVTPHA